MTSIIIAAPGPVFIDPNQQTIHNNAAVVAGGSIVCTGFGVRDINLYINVTAAPTGTTPSLIYTMQELDPGDRATPVGTSVTGSTLTGIGTQTLTLPLTLSGIVRVTWAVSGAGASFTGVYATVVTKVTTVGTGTDSSGVEVPILVDSSGRTATIAAPDLQAEGGLSLIVDPSTGNQSANYVNNVAPSNATLSNTTAGYSTLGGLFQFAAPSGAEIDYALFAYQIPVGYHLYVDSIRIEAFVTGNKSSTSETVLQWALAANSSAVSLATGPPNPPIRFPVGMQSAQKSASRGTAFDPATILYKPRTPIVISPTRFFHVIVRVPVGNPTPSQTIRGFVNVEGYFQLG